MAAMARHTPTGTGTSCSFAGHATAAAAASSTWTRALGTSNHHRRERSVSTTSDDCCSASGTTTTTGRATRYSCHYTPNGRKFQSVGILGFVICYDRNRRTAHTSRTASLVLARDHSILHPHCSCCCGLSPESSRDGRQTQGVRRERSSVHSVCGGESSAALVWWSWWFRTLNDCRHPPGWMLRSRR